MGAVGAVLIWAGLKRSEVPATWMGFVGALLGWVGWFEFTFEFYAGMFRIPEYTSPTGLPIFAGATVLMATMPTSDNGRSVGRITAIETIFVTWACYEFWLYVGYMLNNSTIMVAYVARQPKVPARQGGAVHMPE